MFTNTSPAPVSKTVVLLSGGMDSAVTLALAAMIVRRISCMAIDYRQRHRKELEAAQELAKHYNVHFSVEYVSSIAYNTLLSETSNEPPTPGPQLPHTQLLPKTWIPSRNIIMLAYAGKRAQSIGAQLIAGGWHQEDYPGYPDCRAEFLLAMENALQLGLAYPVNIWAPLLYMTKKQIVELGNALEVPWELTWSCYAGGDKPCGQCDACVRREEAFK